MLRYMEVLADISISRHIVLCHEIATFGVWIHLKGSRIVTVCMASLYQCLYHDFTVGIGLEVLINHTAS